MRHFLGFLAIFLALSVAAHAGPGGGALVIVGGGLSDDNDAVFAAFLDALPTPEAPIAIIPAASGYPAGSAAAFAAQLERRGVAASRIRTIRLATEDDPDTPEDESNWRGNAQNPREVARLADAGGIWFTGGDQARIIAVLLDDADRETALLTALRTRLAAGAVIGGTSAGAAIMSRVMIRQGDPLSLLPGAGDQFEPVATGGGLGFLRQALVDQHFGERARLIRLVAALRALTPPERIGFGIDEDTALVIAPGQQGARVVGRGRVTVVDARAAAYQPGAALAAERAALTVLGPGDAFDLVNMAAQPAQPPVVAAATASPASCIAAPSAAGLPPSESQLVASLAATVGPGAEVPCLIASGREGLALRFHRSAGTGDERLMLDIAPMHAQAAHAPR